MDNGTKLFSGLAVLVIALGSFGAVSAGTIEAAAAVGGYGRGFDSKDEGLMASYMQAAIAEGLGLTIDELNALDADGTRHYLIAIDLGFTSEEYEAILENAQARAIELAIADGIVIQQFGLRGDGETPGMYGTRLLDLTRCNDGTCEPAPVGMGSGRGGRR